MLFMDGFDHYGTGADNSIASGHMNDGLWTGAASVSIGTPSFGAATDLAMLTKQGGSQRKVFDWGTRTAVLVGCRIGLEDLPGGNLVRSICTFNDASNSIKWRVYIQSTGDIALVRESGNLILAQTQAPVLVAKRWQYIEMKIDTVNGNFRLDVDGTTVINASGLALGSTPIAQMYVGLIPAGASFDGVWVDDFHIKDTAGTRNNDFEGDLRIATIFPNANGPDQGWTPQYRHLYGTGILDLYTATLSNNRPGIYCADSSSLRIGNADFTLEGWFRFAALPTGGNKATLFSKWDESNNRRSYQLYLGGPTLNSGNLVFQTSTDGTAGTVVQKISFPWPGGAPDLDTWYHVAVVRASGELLLFINGIQYGLPIADSNTYAANISPYSTGVQIEGSSSNIAGTGFTGWEDEHRLTIGVARYTSNFTPTGPFPRGSGSDPNWAFVSLLMGFNSGIADESSFLRSVNTSAGAVAVTPDDGTGAYQTVSHNAPQDDTFIQAALLPATNTLTLNSQPTANDTVTVGTYTNAGSHAAVYKFVAAVSVAFDVKIGATIADTLFNLRSAINLAAGGGTLYGTGTFVNDDVTALGLPGAQMGVIANIAGTTGNSIASTDTLTDSLSGWASATLTGGANIPGDSDFFMERPPVNTTIIRAVQILTRAFKTDAGAGQVQATFVGPLGGTINGANRNMTLSPTYYFDIFETDPDTSGSITPSTVVGGRVRVNRTA